MGNQIETPSDPRLRAGLQSLTERLVTEISAGSNDIDRVRRLGVAVAVLNSELGLEEDGAVLWSALGFGLLASPASSPADLNQALGFFNAAVELLRGRSGKRAAAVLTSALAGSAAAWARLPGSGSSFAVMTAARESASLAKECVEDTTGACLDVLQIWADLLRHPTFKDEVEEADAAVIHNIARSVLERIPLSENEAYWATEALGLCELRMGDTEKGTETLRTAVALARQLREARELGRSLSALSNELVRAHGPAVYPDCIQLQYEAAAAFFRANDPYAAGDAYRTAAIMAMEGGDWEYALEALRNALPLYEEARMRTLHEDQLTRMVAQIALLHHALTLCLVRLGRLEEAAAAADAARARRLRAIPRLFSDDMERVRERAPALLRKFLNAHRRMRDAETDQRQLVANPAGVSVEVLSEVNQRLGVTREETAKLLSQVRAVPGVEGIFEEPSLAQIRATLPPNAVAAYLVPTPFGGTAILVGEETLEAISLPALTTDGLSEWLGRTAAALDDWRADPSSLEATSAWERAITDSGRWTWEVCMGPVLEHCQSAARLQLLPGAGLEFLPLHAAWSSGPNGEKHYALDAIPISYAPCADLQMTVRDVGPMPGPELFAVADPRPVDATRLMSARTEIEAISSAFQATTTLEGEEATGQAILAAFPHADVIHLACHARVEFGNPYASFLLAACNERLEFSDIIDVELPRRPFVFLSACESGLRDLELADEVQSLAAGFLAAGAKEVISTLWSLFDVTGLLAALMVYHRRLLGDDGLTALREAQLWLRDVSNEEKARAIEEMKWVDPVIRKRIARDVRSLSWEFSSPLHWAAFVYSGP